MISALGPTEGINSNDTYLRINGAIATFQVVFSPNEIFSKPAGNDLSSDTFVRTAGFHRLSRRTVEAKMRLVDLEFIDENGGGAIGATASASAKRELKLRNIGGQCRQWGQIAAQRRSATSSSRATSARCSRTR